MPRSGPLPHVVAAASESLKGAAAQGWDTWAAPLEKETLARHARQGCPFSGPYTPVPGPKRVYTPGFGTGTSLALFFSPLPCFLLVGDEGAWATGIVDYAHKYRTLFSREQWASPLPESRDGTEIVLSLDLALPKC